MPVVATHWPAHPGGWSRARRWFLASSKRTSDSTQATKRWSGTTDARAKAVGGRLCPIDGANRGETGPLAADGHSADPKSKVVAPHDVSVRRLAEFLAAAPLLEAGIRDPMRLRFVDIRGPFLLSNETLRPFISSRPLIIQGSEVTLLLPGYITVTPGGHGPNGRLASTRPHPSFLGTQVTHVDLSCTEQIVPYNLGWRMAVLLSLRPWARISKDHPDRMLAGARLLRFQTSMWRTARPRGPQGQANPEDGQGWMQNCSLIESHKVEKAA